MSYSDMADFYNRNKDFKRYIDECAKAYGREVGYILQTRTAEQYYLSLQKGGCNARAEDNSGVVK